MFKQKLKHTLVVSTTIMAIQMAPQSFASDNASNASYHASQGSKYSALTIGDSAVAGAHVSTAVIAIPLAISGGLAMSAGSASVSIAESMMNATSNKPLPICEEVVIAGPPPSESL
ncbi:hypothetical protein A7985_11065 [Pseudoalteromonas luteoviolacea]|uniref:Uncharacterized protein n=1 Tax=Pseudoalteromonas luteoviolacea TaxID=43657 RepID=A0A1C0TQB1_9GAMM|nr:hypothetical protein [Pseudoalteromonas luteoviolacea]MBQ4811393.1 hypothetical protein [Pseudoalteromonas luteoviolacea]OCQ21167.1 hypothetical protein A7985_11065 [Pseudoalteromonas luteoviolacea]